MTPPRGLQPRDVLPREVGAALPEEPWWFLIGGQAVRCLCPYRPTRDVDLGLREAGDLDQLLLHLERHGEVEVLDRAPETVHLVFEGVHVSLFVLARLADHTDGRRLDVTGLLATKLHAILDRGLRRDFFDLYVLLQSQRVGIAGALQALRRVYGEVNDSVILRAITWFDDAEREADMVGEGPGDWERLKGFFLTQAGSLLTPPLPRLGIQERVVDVVGAGGGGS